MALVHESLNLLLFLAFSTCCLPSFCTTYKTTTILGSSPASSIPRPHRLVSKLIHHHSVLHPHYDPNETAEDQMKLDIHHSVARLSYFQARIEGSLVSNDYRANLYPSLTGRTILANLSIGQPPVPQLVIMDTASSIFWIMCSPCSTCAHREQLFDPSKSSTYVPSCRTPCRFSGCKCDLAGQLTFNITYADSSFSSGTLGNDMLVFETADEGISLVPDIEFGCGHNIGYNVDPGYNGILGLGGPDSGSLSLASQIGHKFSYCIGRLTDKYYSYNQLILGEGADLEGYPTRFQLRHGFYYVAMEGISIGEKRLDIAPGTFEIKEDGTGGVIIDTGCTLTYLNDDAYKLLYQEVKNLLGSFRQIVIGDFQRLPCYFGNLSRDLEGFPVVTFHFAEGADLVLDSLSLFKQLRRNVFCMTVAPIGEAGIESDSSVVGLLAQQSYNVGYDLVNGFIYFQRIDCELLSG